MAQTEDYVGSNKQLVISSHVQLILTIALHFKSISSFMLRDISPMHAKCNTRGLGRLKISTHDGYRHMVSSWGKRHGGIIMLILMNIKFKFLFSKSANDEVVCLRYLARIELSLF